MPLRGYFPFRIDEFFGKSYRDPSIPFFFDYKISTFVITGEKRISYRYSEQEVEFVDVNRTERRSMKLG